MRISITVSAGLTLSAPTDNSAMECTTITEDFRRRDQHPIRATGARCWLTTKGIAFLHRVDDPDQEFGQNQEPRQAA